MLCAPAHSPTMVRRPRAVSFFRAAALGNAVGSRGAAANLISSLKPGRGRNEGRAAYKWAGGCVDRLKGWMGCRWV